MSVSAHATNRGIKHDAILRAALLQEIAEIHPAGRHGLRMENFTSQRTQDLRNSVAALEQDKAQSLIDTYKKGPHTQRDLAKALIELARLAGKPVSRYAAAPEASAGFLGARPVIPGNEAREDALNILTAGLSRLKFQKHVLPIVTDLPNQRMEDSMRYAKKWWLISPMTNAEREDTAVSIALIDHGRPVLGIVHFPRLGRSYAGIPEQNWAVRQLDKQPRRIRVRARGAYKHVAAAAPDMRGTDTFRAFRQSQDVKRTFGETGGAYGLCRLAQGSFDFYLHPDAVSQSSIAAAQAVAMAAGGAVLSFDGTPLSYGPNAPKAAFTAPSFVAAANPKQLHMRDVRRLVVP